MGTTLKITMTETDASPWTGQPGLHLLVQSNELTDLPRTIASFSPTQREIFVKYLDQPSDFRPVLGRQDGYRYTSEWLFPKKEF